MMDKEDKLSEKAHRNPDVPQLRVDVFKLLNELESKNKKNAK